MKKHYDVVNGLLEVGIDGISKHLQWLLKNIIFDTVGDTEEALHSVLYQPNDVPVGIWGEFIPHARSIVVNIEQHFENSLLTVQEHRYMHMSIKTHILSELMDTLAHEAWHAKKCLEANDWNVEELDEAGAKKHGETTWSYAEHMDVNVKSFGSILDTLLANLYKEFKVDVEEADCKEWKKIQLHMMDNNIHYYNPETNIEIRTIREVFQAQTHPKNQWVSVSNDMYTSWPGNMPNDCIDTAKPELVVIKEPEQTIVETPVPVTSTLAAPTVQAPAPTLQAPVVPAAPAATTVCSDYDPLNDIGVNMPNPFDDDADYTAPIAAISVTNTTIETPAVAVPVATPVVRPLGVVENVTAVSSMDVLKIQAIAETVLRRIFHHVHSKCEFNTEGTYNNAGAVIEPINISDIEGHEELFVEQDCLDAKGTFQSHAPVNGMIRGLITNEGLPQYRFYMNIGGVKHKRLFNVSKNNTTKQGGGLTAWAEKTCAGHRLMSLYNGTERCTTASIELAPNQVLGQEVFKIWDQKK